MNLRWGVRGLTVSVIDRVSIDSNVTCDCTSLDNSFILMVRRTHQSATTVRHSLSCGAQARSEASSAMTPAPLESPCLSDHSAAASPTPDDHPFGFRSCIHTARLAPNGCSVRDVHCHISPCLVHDGLARILPPKMAGSSCLTGSLSKGWNGDEKVVSSGKW